MFFNYIAKIYKEIYTFCNEIIDNCEYWMNEWPFMWILLDQALFHEVFGFKYPNLILYYNVLPKLNQNLCHWGQLEQSVSRYRAEYRPMKN